MQGALSSPDLFRIQIDANINILSSMKEVNIVLAYADDLVVTGVGLENLRKVIKT